MGKSPRDVSHQAEFAPATHLVNETCFFMHPDEVLACRSLSNPERRAILAAWASDAHAVEGQPSLRQLKSGAMVPVSEILRALRALDHCDGIRRGPRRTCDSRPVSTEKPPT